MFKGLILDNFKPFGTRQAIPFAPLTLIFGPNSSGKSSIIQSLLLLKQSIDDNPSAGSQLRPRGPLVDLGSFNSFVFAHDETRTVEITPLLSPDAVPEKLFDPTTVDRDGRSIVVDRRTFVKPPDYPNVYPSSFSGLGARLCISSDMRDVTVTNPVYWDMVSLPLFELGPLSSQQQERLAFYRESRPMAAVSRLEQVHSFWAKLYDNYAQRRADYLEKLREHLREYTEGYFGRARLGEIVDPPPWLIKTVEKHEHYSFTDFVEDLHMPNSVGYLIDGTLPFAVARAFEEDDDAGAFDWRPDLLHAADILANRLRVGLISTTYLGPLRQPPARYYIYGGAAPRDIGPGGAHLPDLLFSDVRRGTDILGRLNGVLDRFDIGLAFDLSAFTATDIPDVYALRLLDHASSTAVSLVDVGFGVSQLLPILVETLRAERRTILIEQPELHLHPRLQAELGSLFAECVRERGNQFIIETHSEHLILRIQALIHRGELRQEDVSVLYVERTQEGSTCIPLKIDADGDFIDEWPDGFFPERQRERLARFE